MASSVVFSALAKTQAQRVMPPPVVVLHQVQHLPMKRQKPFRHQTQLNCRIWEKWLVLFRVSHRLMYLSLLQIDSKENVFFIGGTLFAGTFQL